MVVVVVARPRNRFGIMKGKFGSKSGVGRWPGPACTSHHRCNMVHTTHRHQPGGILITSLLPEKFLCFPSVSGQTSLTCRMCGYGYWSSLDLAATKHTL